MLAVLSHGTLVTENSDRWEENKKYYLNLIKKLKVGPHFFSSSILQLNAIRISS